MISGQSPVLVLNTNTKRQTGNKAQIANILAAKAISDIVSTTLGPQSMLKMLLDPMGSIVMTNDGNAILRQIDVQHPAAKSMIQLARAQDQQVGDGTTSVIIMTGELMVTAKSFLQLKIHPTVIVKSYYKALQIANKVLQEIAKPINLDGQQVQLALQSCIGTKFASKWGKMISDLTIKAVRMVSKGSQRNKLGLQLKRYAKIQKIPGGTLQDCCVLDGVMVNKDITHPSMRRTIKNPRVILLDCPLQYKKGESQTNIQMSKQSDMTDALKQQMQQIALMCNDILKHNPDVVITQKGISDLAQHFLLKGNVSCIRRVRKTDNVRIARVTGAKIVTRAQEIQDTDVGTSAGLFQIKKIGDQYFTYFLQSPQASACTILLRGASKDVLNQMQRNLHDCLGAAKNIFADPRLVPGGGAVQMAISNRINQQSIKYQGKGQMVLKAVGYAIQIIPKVLAQNCGADAVRMITQLRAKHSIKGNQRFGVDGNARIIRDISQINVWQPILVASQVIKTAVQASSMLLRIDDVISGIKKKDKQQKSKFAGSSPAQAQETFGDARDG